MPRLGILNFVLGFLFIFLSSSAGLFLATDQAQMFVNDPEALGSWWVTLSTSAHGHTNLFGMLHVLLGLTLPYGVSSRKLDVMKTAGVFLGAFAMSVLMTVRAMGKPVVGYDALGVLMGICFAAALTAIGLHLFGLLSSLYKRDS